MTRPALSTLDALWQAVLPSYTPEEQKAAIVLLRELSKGEPVAAADLAGALNLPTGEVARGLAGSALRPFVYTGADGRIAGFWGLSTKPTHHRFTIGERTLWTWCAEDSLFLPELLGETARVESSDPETGEPVRLTISPTRIERAEPEGIAVSMVGADTADFTSAARIIATACHYIFFFADPASGERWVAAHRQTTLVSLEDAFALARRQNARLFGQELERRSRT
ncbi:MAG: organomercurial lyase [Longimicrobiales bacterium]